MLKIDKILKSKEFKNNSSAHSYFAKKIIKVIRFFSYREKELNDNIHNIKYNHLTHIIEKTFTNKNINKIIFEDLIKNLKFYINEKINLSNETFEEIINLFSSCIHNEKIVKKDLLKEINSNIHIFEEFFNQSIYSEKKRKKSEKLKIESIQKVISKKYYEDFYYSFFHFYNSFFYYNKLLNGEYHYVLKSNFLINYCNLFSDDFLNRYESILEELELYENILNLKKLLVDYTNNLNLELFISNKNIDPSFYVQEENRAICIEKEVLNYNFYCSFHGGERFFNFNNKEDPKLLIKRKELACKFKDGNFLKNIVFHERHLFDLETYSDCFLFEIDKRNNYLLFMNQEYEILDIYKPNHYSKIKMLVYKNKEKLIKTDLKTDFLFKDKQDYYEIIFIDNNQEDVFKVRFFIDKYQIIDVINKKDFKHNYGYNNN